MKKIAALSIVVLAGLFFVAMAYADETADGDWSGAKGHYKGLTDTTIGGGSILRSTELFINEIEPIKGAFIFKNTQGGPGEVVIIEKAIVRNGELEIEGSNRFTAKLKIAGPKITGTYSDARSNGGIQLVKVPEQK